LICLFEGDLGIFISTIFQDTVQFPFLQNSFGGHKIALAVFTIRIQFVLGIPGFDRAILIVEYIIYKSVFVDIVVRRRLRADIAIGISVSMLDGITLTRVEGVDYFIL
jgi:hypothetical protein